MSNQQALSKRIIQTIRKHNLLKSGDTVIVALSGGADSCALLDLLATLPGFPLRLIAAHLNHCLRSSDSDADETFSRNLAKHYGIPFESRRTDVAAYASDNRLSLEDAGRKVRISFFDELLDKWRAHALALGHHRDDQVETFLMRLLRGSGGTGLSGMSFSSRRRYIRPLLDISRSEIEAYLNERNLAWREDVSNRDTAFIRNRIRHELLPLLEQYNPAIRERLAATTGILADEGDLMTSLAQQEYDYLANRSGGSVGFDVSALKELHPALLNRVIRITVSECAGSLQNLSKIHVSIILSLLADGPPNRSISLPGALMVRREYGRIIFCCEVTTDDKQQSHVLIQGFGHYQLWDGMMLEVSPSRQPEHLKETPADTAYHDLVKTPFPWHVRMFRPGDRMVPLGMVGSKKVKDIFIDGKVALVRRRRIPLIFSHGTLTWLCGLLFSDSASISNESVHIAKSVLRTSSPDKNMTPAD